jgi:Leucine-rich repeat (LRR) protein
VLCTLPQLTVLKIDRNPIAALPPAIGGLQNLAILDCWDTMIEGLPPEIAQCKSLRHLDLRNTKIYKTDLPALMALLPNTEIQVTFGCSCNK